MSGVNAIARAALHSRRATSALMILIDFFFSSFFPIQRVALAITFGVSSLGPCGAQHTMAILFSGGSPFGRLSLNPHDSTLNLADGATMKRLPRCEDETKL